MKERHCAYCRNIRPDEGFRRVLSAVDTSVRYMCPGCQGRRKLPRAKLVEMAQVETEERRAAASAAAALAARETFERKRKLT
jgi:hypothetical protein